MKARPKMNRMLWDIVIIITGNFYYSTRGSVLVIIIQYNIAIQCIKLK